MGEVTDTRAAPSDSENAIRSTLDLLRMIACGTIAVTPDTDAGLMEFHRRASIALNAILADRDRWIPVTERLPDDSRNVLACTATEVGITRYWAQWSTPHWDWDGDGITHWRELPWLPEEK